MPALSKPCCATCDYCVEFKDEFNCCASPLCENGYKAIPEYLLNRYCCVQYSNTKHHKYGNCKPLMEKNNEKV
jgi:hypothetical protein